MLRWVARVLRWVLFVIGVVLLIWLPCSWKYLGMVRLTSSTNIHAISYKGGVQIFAWTSEEAPFALSMNVIDPVIYLQSGGPGFTHDSQWPRIRGVHVGRNGPGTISIAFPIWLLAFLCLAWPVTSLLLARRRGKGRGFAVEAGGGGPAPGIDPPPRRPDNIPPP